MLKDGGKDQPVDQAGHRSTSQGLGQAQLFGHLREQPERTDGQALPGIDSVFECAELGQASLMFEGQLEGLDLFLGALGEVGNGVVSDLAVDAVGVAQQDASIGPTAVAIGGVIDKCLHINAFKSYFQ